MLDPADCVKDLLATAGVGTFNTVTGWCLSIGQWPDSPDTCILINQTGGRPPYPQLLINFPSVHCVVRGSKSGYQAARTKAGDIVDALLGMNSTLVGQSVSPAYAGDMYRACNQIGDIAYLGQDENTRPMFSLNFSFIVLPADTGGHRVAIT